MVKYGPAMENIVEFPPLLSPCQLQQNGTGQSHGQAHNQPSSSSAAAQHVPEKGEPQNPLLLAPLSPSADYADTGPEEPNSAQP